MFLYFYGSLTFLNQICAMNFFYLAFLMLVGQSLCAQQSSAPDVLFAWSQKHSVVNDSNYIFSLKSSKGYLYGIGKYRKATYTMGNATLINQGGQDLFVAKWDTSGNILWIKSIVGSKDEAAVNIAFDTSGNLLIAGVFNSTVLSIAQFF